LYDDGVMAARACLEVVAIACRAADISGNQCRGDVSLACARQKAAGRRTKSHLASDALDATVRHNKEEERHATDASERHQAAHTMSQVINGKPAAPLAAPAAAQGPFNGRELAAYLKQCEQACSLYAGQQVCRSVLMDAAYLRQRLQHGPAWWKRPTTPPCLPPVRQSACTVRPCAHSEH
jgi:hypothetical protein